MASLEGRAAHNRLRPSVPKRTSFAVSIARRMSQHVLLEDDEDGDGLLANSNGNGSQPQQPQQPQQDDWRSKLGAFARKAGDTIQTHSKTAMTAVQGKIAEARGMYSSFHGFVCDCIHVQRHIRRRRLIFIFVYRISPH